MVTFPDETAWDERELAFLELVSNLLLLNLKFKMNKTISIFTWNIFFLAVMLFFEGLLI